jgi:Zn-dependent metalloprotease
LEIDEAYDGLGASFDLFLDIYGRKSIDDACRQLIATAHYGDRYNNAVWDGSQMVFGDGDPTIFNRFTLIDITGHELTHGVTGATAGLFYNGQSGALNESISDVFGSLIKQRSLGQAAAEADWLIGAGAWAANINGVAFRSMKAPGTAYHDPLLKHDLRPDGKDPQPAHMRDYVNTELDNGGVHVNSGIPNKARSVAMRGTWRATSGIAPYWIQGFPPLRDSKTLPVSLPTMPRGSMARLSGESWSRHGTR